MPPETAPPPPPPPLSRPAPQLGRPLDPGGAAVGLQPHQPFDAEPAQGFAHRHARHAELGGELVLDQPLAGPEPALENIAADLVADELAERSAFGHGYFFNVAMKASLPASQQALSCSPLPPEAAIEPTHWPSTKIGKPPTNTVKRPSCWVKMPNASSPGSAFL